MHRASISLSQDPRAGAYPPPAPRCPPIISTPLPPQALMVFNAAWLYEKLPNTPGSRRASINNTQPHRSAGLIARGDNCIFRDQSQQGVQGRSPCRGLGGVPQYFLTPHPAKGVQGPPCRGFGGVLQLSPSS